MGGGDRNGNGEEQKWGREGGSKRGVENKRGERRQGEQERKTTGARGRGSGGGRVQSSFCSWCDISSHSVFLTDGIEADLNWQYMKVRINGSGIFE